MGTTDRLGGMIMAHCEHDVKSGSVIDPYGALAVSDAANAFKRKLSRVLRAEEGACLLCRAEEVARIEKKLDHLTGLLEEVLAYLDGMDKKDEPEDDWDGGRVGGIGGGR